MKKQDYKSKHDHKLTDWLKVIIFSILMMAPFFSIATRCLYVINNKNAKDSYSGSSQTIINYKYESNQVNNIDDIQVGNIYYLDYLTLDYMHYSQGLQFNSLFLNIVKLDSLTYTANDELTEEWGLDNFDIKNCLLTISIEYDDSYSFAIFYIGNETYYLSMSIDNFSILSLNHVIFYLSDSSDILGLSSALQSFENNAFPTYTDYNVIESVDIATGTLDNAFDYSISQLAESPTFNWTTQTATYEVFDDMLTGLTIQGGILPILLTYWMMLIVVYIIVDIIIKTFTFITHLIAQ